MKYMLLRKGERKDLLKKLAAMPAFLEQRFASLSPEAAASPGPGNAFSPVEHCWHLADLEREGFGLRLRRLREEAGPVLPDFDGGRIAGERNYRMLSLDAGIAAFRRSRLDNLAVIHCLRDEEWFRSGIQEGVGKISLCNIPGMMLEHDSAHRAEIERWEKAAHLL